MKECAYGREPVNAKLMFLLFLKKTGVFLSAAAIGALLVGGYYFVTEILMGEGVTYSATSTYYVQYGTDPQTGNEYTYINGVTWDSTWVKSDAFLQDVQTFIREENNSELSVESLKRYISADLPSDLRMPVTTVKTEEEELTMLVAGAVEKAMMQLGANPDYREIEEISVVISAKKAEITLIDDRTVSAVILGALLGLFTAVVIWCIRYFMDDSVYVPDTFETRYGIPMLGTLESPYLAENFKYLFAGKKSIALLGTDSDGDMTEIKNRLSELLQDVMAGEDGVQLIPMPGAEQCPEVFGAIRQLDGLLLCVEAGARDGKRTEELLATFEKQDITVDAALLIHEDEALQRVYYLRKGKKPEM